MESSTTSKIENKVNLFSNLSEEDVGISEYLNKESLGFQCVLKHRYTDFLVNEIDHEGNVVFLKNENIINQDTNIKINNLPKEKVVVANDENVDSIILENFTLNNLVTNPNDIQNFADFLHKYFNLELPNDQRLYLDYIDDKNNRKIFHDKVRELFDSLDSETLSELHGGSVNQNRNNNKFKNKQQRKNEKEKGIRLKEESKIEVDPNIPTERKMVIFVNKNKANMFMKRKFFPDYNKKVLHFSMMKRNMDTVQAVNYIARILHRSSKTIKFAGNKDKRGITTQRISAYSTMTEELTNVCKQKFWDKRIELDSFEYKEEELRLGMLKGNQFSVVFRFIEIPNLNNLTNFNEIEKEIESSISSIKSKGFINYFGMQRFGVSTVPTHKVGLHLIKKQWREAIACILSTSEIKEALRMLGLLKNLDTFEQFTEVFDSMENVTDLLKVINRFSNEFRILNTIKKSGKNSFMTAFKSLNRQLQLLYPHAYQSYIWNKSVSERIKKHGLTLLIGDIVKKRNVSLDQVESLTAIDDLIDEDLVDDKKEEDEENKVEEVLTKVLDVDKIFEDNYEYVTEENINNYTFDDLYFSVVGYQVKYPKNETFNYITELLKVDDIKLEDFAEKNLNFNSTGFFRKVIQKPNEIKYELIRHDLPDVDLQNEYYNVEAHHKPESIENKYSSLRLQFQLPQSTYATMLFRELTKKSSAANYQANLSKNIQK